MKKVATFRLSEEALAVLDKQNNKSQYLEDLILGEKTPLKEKTNSSVKTSLSGGSLTEGVTEGRVLYLIQQEMAKIPPSGQQQPQQPVMPQLLETPKGSVLTPKSVPTNLPNTTTGAQFVPKPPDPEFGYPCCKGISPCKHWIFDETDAVWRNSLTGKERDA